MIGLTLMFCHVNTLRPLWSMTKTALTALPSSTQNLRSFFAARESRKTFPLLRELLRHINHIKYHNMFSWLGGWSWCSSCFLLSIRVPMTLPTVLLQGTKVEYRCFQFFWCLVVFVVFSFPFCSHSSSPPETSESFASVFLESWQQTSALFPMMFAALSLVSSEFSRSKLWGSLFIVGYGSYTAISRVGGSYPKAAKLPLERTWVEWCRMWIYRSCNAFIQEESGQTSNSYHSKSGNGDENGEDQIFFGL